MGLGVAVIGIIAASTMSTESVVAMNPGDTTPVAGYDLRFDGLREIAGPNYTAQQGEFTVSRGGVVVDTISAAKRFYPARGMPTTESGILTFGASQLYISLGELDPNGGMVVRIWWKSLVTLIWFGPILMMIGGLFSLSDRRLRIGAPNRARVRKQAGATA
jgi:cytochrome c-type biogenesis protein CcmF